MFSAIQLKKDLKHGDETYLVAIRKVQDDALDVVLEVLAHVLKNFIKTMHAEPPRQLPPRFKVNHAVDLVPDAKPLAMALYRMAPVELKELRIQLDEILEGGVIRPSKALHGAPVLFQLNTMDLSGCV